MFLTKQPWNASPSPAPGTMPLTSKTISSPKIARFILSLYRNKLNWTNSSKKPSRKDISGHLNQLWPHPSFLSIKKMENYDPVRITEPSMKELSRMLTPLPLISELIDKLKGAKYCVLYTPPGCPVGLRSDSASPVDIHRTLVICTGLCWMSGDCLVIVR